MLMLKLNPRISKKEWDSLCDIWEKSSNTSLNMSAIGQRDVIDNVAGLALDTIDRDLSQAVLSEIAEQPAASEPLLMTLFDRGGDGCREAIALRENLCKELLIKCLQANLVHKKSLKPAFLKLMQFPKEWLVYDLYPDELFHAQASLYRQGDEEGAEHDRNGAFHWWLKKQPSTQQLVMLAKLSFLDPDPIMAEDIRRYISMSKHFDESVRDAIAGMKAEFGQ